MGSEAKMPVAAKTQEQQTQTANTKDDERNKGVTFTSFPFTDFISEINKTRIDNAKDFDVVISMYNLIEYSDNYSKTSGI